MLQSVGLQRVGRNLETEQQQQIIMSEEKSWRNTTKVPRVERKIEGC